MPVACPLPLDVNGDIEMHKSFVDDPNPFDVQSIRDWIAYVETLELDADERADLLAHGNRMLEAALLDPDALRARIAARPKLRMFRDGRPAPDVES